MDREQDARWTFRHLSERVSRLSCCGAILRQWRSNRAMRAFPGELSAVQIQQISREPLQLQTSTRHHRLYSPRSVEAVAGAAEANSTDTISWGHATSVVEVKNSWPFIVSHTPDKFLRTNLTGPPYDASCSIKAASTKDAVIAELDRAGGYATHMRRLSDERGLRQFSLLLVGMYCSFTDAHGFSRRIQPESDGTLRVWTRDH